MSTTSSFFLRTQPVPPSRSSPAILQQRITAPRPYTFRAARAISLLWHSNSHRKTKDWGVDEKTTPATFVIARMVISSSFQHLHVTLLRRATTKNCLQPPREVFAAHRHMRKKINTHISHPWLLNTSYHLAMRKFPSHRVPKGARGLRGNSARPDVMLLWSLLWYFAWHWLWGPQASAKWSPMNCTPMRCRSAARATPITQEGPLLIHEFKTEKKRHVCVNVLRKKWCQHLIALILLINPLKNAPSPTNI